MDISSLRFTPTKFRTGYNQQEVDRFVDLIAANLALPLAVERALGQQVTEVCFTSTTFRAGYDVDEVDHVLATLGIRLDLPSPTEPDGHPNELRPELLWDRPDPTADAST